MYRQGVLNRSQIGKIVRISAYVILALFLSCLFPADVFAAKRLALIIANSKYKNTAALVNPPNDAALLKQRLEQLEFKVDSRKDIPNADEVSRIIRDFVKRLDSETVALFYYAGHGIQYRGENLLVGTDARLTDEDSLQGEAVPLTTITGLLESQAETTLLFWDACRNNPLATVLHPNGSPLGPAPITGRSANTFIVLSAAPGSEALDGNGDNGNSPFAESLANRIATPDIGIEQMLTMVAGDVLESTRGRQRPDRSSQLDHVFFFNAKGSETKALEQQIMLQQRKNREDVRSLPPARKQLPTIGPHVTRVVERSSPQPPITRSFDPLYPTFTINLPLTTTIRRIRISPDGKILALGGDDGYIRVLSLETFSVIRGVQAHTSRISDLDFSPDGRILLSTGRDGSAQLWRVDTGTPAGELVKVSNRSLNSGRINPSFPNRFALFGDFTGHVYAKDLKRNQPITDRKFHSGPVVVAYQPNGKGTFFSAGGDGLVNIRLPEGQRKALTAHKGRIFDADYDSTGRLAYTVGYDRKIKIWDTRKGFFSEFPLHVMDGHLNYVLAASMSRTAKTLASGGGDKVVNVWSVESGKLIARLVGHTSDVEAVAITPDSRFVISTSEDKSLRIWSLENRQELLSMYFRTGTRWSSGLTFDKQLFGDQDSGLVTVRVGKEILDGNQYDKYIGREISISDN
jgi:WD40 repeat protein